MKIAILGTRGIPNHYGGFERCAEEIAQFFVGAGHEVVVYVSSEHPYRETSWNGVQLKRVLSPEKTLGSLAALLYDGLCLRSAATGGFDVILNLGYNPAALFFRSKRRTPMITNMDGLEWKRSKWGFFAKKLSKFCERRAVERSDLLISDNHGIADYLKMEYDAKSIFVPYGGRGFSPKRLSDLDRERTRDYFLVVARLEPENNIEMVIRGFLLSDSPVPLKIVGSLATKHGQYLQATYRDSRVQFLGGIYDLDELDRVRASSLLYFHGHSVGGTNPSLVEAMELGLPIVAHDNPFNRSVLGPDAEFFEDAESVRKLIVRRTELDFEGKIVRNRQKVRETYSWQTVSNQYLAVIDAAVGAKG